jgi:seryl-tRNA synthetase
MINYVLPDKINGSKMHELLDRVPYLSEKIRKVSYDEATHSVNIGIDTNDEEEIDNLHRHLNEIVETLRYSKIITQKTIRSRKSENASKRDYDYSLHAYFDEDEFELYRMLDYFFLNIAKKYNALIRDYPIILNANNMSRNNYHKNFPQNVFSVSHVPHNYEQLQQFREAEQHDTGNIFVHHGQYLRPCICYHCYEEFQEQSVDQPIIVTSQGKCFRHEIEWKVNRSRKNEFYMREIVFIDKPEQVVTLRDQIMNDVWSLFEDIDLNGSLVSARDPFFYYDDLKNKGAYQLMSHAKYELEAESRHSSYSIASFNYCENLLCQKFNITDSDNEYLHSGCVAFGIDRWMEAIFHRYGKEKKNWSHIAGGLYLYA